MAAPVPEHAQGGTLAQAAAAAAGDPGQAPRVEQLCQLIRLRRDPEGLRGAHAAAMAPKLGAPEHLVLVAIARLTGRDVLEVAAETEPVPVPAPKPQSVREQRRERAAVDKLQQREAFTPTGEADLDQLVDSMPQSFIARAAAGLIEPRVGARDPSELRAWERAPLVTMVGSEELVDAALQLLAAIRARPHIRVAWENWQQRQAPDAPRHGSPPAGPPDRRRRYAGERGMGELRRRLAAAQQVPVPRPLALRWPVILDPLAERDADTGLYAVTDLLGEVSCSFKPTLRYMRYMLGCALLLREADHEPNAPDAQRRRTVFTSYNALTLAATGREGCQGEEYDHWDAFLHDMVAGHLSATDKNAGKHKGDYSLSTGTFLESVSVLLKGGEVMALALWRELPEEQRARRRRGGPGPTLMLTYTEEFYAAVMKREGHFLVDKAAAWAMRSELALMLCIETHTGWQRSPDALWELFTGPAFLAQVGYHGSDQRACELLVEDAVDAIEEAWAPVTSATMGDAKNGCASLAVSLDRRKCGLRDGFKGRRTRTRQERREARAIEHPERVGRRRTFAPTGSPGRARQRREARESRRAGAPAGAGTAAIKPASRRRHDARQRARVQGDLAAAAAAREAA